MQEGLPFYEFAHSVLTITGRSGANDVMAICPFHLNAQGVPERSGSFAFSLESGLWYCHACGDGGGFRSFLRKLGYEEGDVEDSLLSIASAAAAERPRVGLWPGYLPPSSHVPEYLLSLFDTGEKVPVEARRWGFRKTTLQHFDVGYDPKNLRITFPLRDRGGRLVGFSGRTVGSSKARYKVYGPYEYRKWGVEGPVEVEKGQLLWNLEPVEASLRFSWDAKILVVEGFKACMWLWQLGFHNTLALMGSSMTEVQQRILESLGGTLYLFLDNDKAGEKKNEIANRLAGCGCSVHVPVYPTHQPDQLTVEQVKDAIETSEYHIYEESEVPHGLWKDRRSEA